MNDEPQTIGQRLRAARDAAGLTQRAVSVAADIDSTYLSSLERDEIPNPGVELMLRLAHALGTTLDDLCGKRGTS